MAVVVAAPLSPLAVELVLFLGDISILLFFGAAKQFVTASFVCGRPPRVAPPGLSIVSEILRDESGMNPLVRVK